MKTNLNARIWELRCSDHVVYRGSLKCLKIYVDVQRTAAEQLDKAVLARARQLVGQGKVTAMQQQALDDQTLFRRLDKAVAKMRLRPKKVR